MASHNIQSSNEAQLRADVQRASALLKLDQLLRSTYGRLSLSLRDPFTGFATTGFFLCVLLVLLELGTDAGIVWLRTHGGAR